MPEGRHPAGLDEVRIVFVDCAPHSEHRRLIFRALELYADRVRQVFPGARLWVDGGFVTHKVEAPKDVDVVVIANEVAPGVTEDEVMSLMTLMQVHAMHQQTLMRAERVQPFGGLIDGFIVGPQPEAREFWDDWWRQVKGTTRRKGYVEVIL